MRDRRFIVWIVLGVGLVAILNAPDSLVRSTKALLRDAVAPVQSALAGLSLRTSQTVESLRGLGGLVTENQQMGEELIRLRDEVRALRALETENETLRQQLGFASQSSRSLIPCEVVARDLTGWWHTLRLGRGDDAGIEEGLAVVTPDGLLGKTTETTRRTTEVLLVSDPGCKVSAQIVRTRTFGVLSGGGVSPGGHVLCILDFVDKNVAIRAGDQVVTSGLGGVFPRGILIGYVDRVDVDEMGLYQRAWVVPKADVSGVRYAFVVKEEEDPVARILRRRAELGRARP